MVTDKLIGKYKIRKEYGTNKLICKLKNLLNMHFSILQNRFLDSDMSAWYLPVLKTVCGLTRKLGYKEA